jgi:hypothetical protein
MGASGWSYRVPYQPDLNQALQQLRTAVFERGAYYKPAVFYEHLLEVVDTLPGEVRQGLEEQIEQRKQLPPPGTIEELFEQNGEEGTHSILDIDRVDTADDFGVINPLSRDELLAFFGTEQPGWQQVEPKADELQSLRVRWQGVCVIIYEDDSPREIFFTGYSGD